MYAAGCSIGKSEGVEAMSGCRRAATAAVVGALTFGTVLVGGAGPAGAESSVPGGEVTPLQAQEVAQRTDPSLLAPSTTATIEAQLVQPAMRDTGEELSSAGALTTSSISKETPGGFAVNTADGELGLTPLSTASATSTPTVVNGAVALFANAWPGTDALVRPQALGAMTTLQIRSAQAPTSFSWELQLGPGQHLQQLANGSVAVVDTPLGSTLEGPVPSNSGETTSEASESAGETSQAGEETQPSETQPAEQESALPSLPPAAQSTTPPAQPASGLPQPQEVQAQETAGTNAMQAAEQQTVNPLMVISPSGAVDARGITVPASLSIVGNTVTMTVSPNTGATFPVMASLAVAGPSAHASAAKAPKLIYGFSDQRPTTFGASFDPRLIGPPLNVAVARLIVSYDAAYKPTEEKEATEKKEGKIEATENERLVAFLKAVGEMKTSTGAPVEPYVTFWSKPCLSGEACVAPSLKRYRKAVKAMIKRYMTASAGLPAVTVWGAWNEPNGGDTPLHSVKAAELWQTAHSTMVGLHCGCTMVAGEFSGFSSGYVSSYKKYMVKHKLKPAVWGMHDYHDLVDVEAPLASYKNQDAEEFAKITSSRLGKPRIWLSEQGVELKSTTGLTRLYGNNELQKLSAEDFLRLAGVSNRTELVDYYQYGAPGPVTGHPHPEEELTFIFDSALKNEKGEPRPAYCVLAFENHECPKPPTVITGPVHPLTKNCLGEGNTLELTGEINPNGLSTSYYFEYAEEDEKFLKTHIEAAGSGTTPIKVSSTVTVKDPVLLCWSITYRLVGVNASGTTNGETRSEYESI
jgi:hypothetical protein